MDLQIFQAINNFAGRSGFLDWLGRFLATDLTIIIGVVLVALWLLKKDSRRMIFVGFLSAGIAALLVTLIRLVYHLPRPILVTDVHTLVINTDWSFPSRHTSLLFALATAIYLYNKKLGGWLFVVALFVGIARIFVGVHWPSDILAGALLGVLVGWVVNRIIKRNARLAA